MPATASDSHEFGYPFASDCQYLCSYLANSELWEKLCTRLLMSEDGFEQSVAEAMKAIGFQHFVTEYQKSLAARNALNEQFVLKIAGTKSALKRAHLTPTVLGRLVLFNLLVSGLPTQLGLTSRELHELSDEEETEEIDNIFRKIVDPESQFLLLAAFALSKPRSPGEYKTLFSGDEMLDWAKPSKSTRKPTNSDSLRKAPSQRPKKHPATESIEESSSDQGDESAPSSSSTESQPLSGLESTSSSPTPTLPLESASSKSAILDDSSTSHLSEDPIASENYSDWTFPKVCQEIEQLQTKLSDLETFRVDIKTLRSDCEDLRSRIGSGFQSIGKNSQINKLIHSSALRKQYGWDSGQQSVTHLRRQLESEKRILITFENTCRDYNDHITDLKRLGLTDSIEPLPLDFSNIEKLQLSLQSQLETLSSLVDRSKELETSFQALKESIKRTEIGDSDLIKEVDKFCSKQLKKSNLMATVIGNRILARNRPASDTQPPIGIPLPILGALFQNCTEGTQIQKILEFIKKPESNIPSSDSSWLRIAQYWSEDFFREQYSILPAAFISDLFPYLLAKGIYDNSTELLYLATSVGNKTDDNRILMLSQLLTNSLNRGIQLEEITSSLDTKASEDIAPRKLELAQKLENLISLKKGKGGGSFFEILKLLAAEFEPLITAVKTTNQSKVRDFLQIGPEAVLKNAIRSAPRKLKNEDRLTSWALAKKVKPAFEFATQWLRLNGKTKPSNQDIKRLCEAISTLDIVEAFTSPSTYINNCFEHLEWFLHDEQKHPTDCQHLHLSTKHDATRYRLYLATDLICNHWKKLDPSEVKEWYENHNDFESVALTIEQLFDEDEKFNLLGSLKFKFQTLKEPFYEDSRYLEASKFRDKDEEIELALQCLDEALEEVDLVSAREALEHIGDAVEDYRRASDPKQSYFSRFLRESGETTSSGTTIESMKKMVSELKKTKFTTCREHCSDIVDFIDFSLTDETDLAKKQLLQDCLNKIDLPSAYPTATVSSRLSSLLNNHLLDYVGSNSAPPHLAQVLAGLLIEFFTAEDSTRRSEAHQQLIELKAAGIDQRLSVQVTTCSAWLAGSLPEITPPPTVSVANGSAESHSTTTTGRRERHDTLATVQRFPDSETATTEEKLLKTQIKKADQFREDIQLLDLIPISAPKNDKTEHQINFKPGDDAWQQTKLLLRKRTVDWGSVHQILIENCQFQVGEPLSETESLSILAAVKVFSTDPDKPLKDKIDANAILLDVLAIKPPITLIGQDVYALLLQSSVKIFLTAELNKEIDNKISFDSWIEDHHSAIFDPGSKLINLDDDFNRRSKLRPSGEDYSNFPGSILAVLYNSLRSITNRSEQIKTRSRILKHLFGRGDLPSINYLLGGLKDIGEELKRVIQSLHAAQSDPIQREAVNTQIHAINHLISKKSIKGVRPFLDFLNGVQDELTSTIAAEGILNIREHEVDLEIDDSPYLSVKFWITNDSDDWFDQAIITVEETEDSFGEIEPIERSQNTDATELNSNQAFLLNPESGEIDLGPGSRITAHMIIPVHEDHADFYRIPYSITYRSTKGNEKTVSGNVTYLVPPGFVEQPSESWLDKHYEGRTGNPVTKTAFHGRTAIMSKLSSVIQKNESALIHGARRVGKTSLIDVLKQEACDPNTGYQMPDLSRSFILKVIMSRADTDVNGPQRMAGDLIYRIIEAIEGEPGLKARIQEAAGPHRDVIAGWKKSLTKEVENGFSVARSILKIYDYLKDQGILQRMVLFIDEAQVLRNASDSKRIFGFLRDEIMHNRDVPISFIFVGSGALKFVNDNPDHPLYHSVEVAELKGFDMKEDQACDQTFLPRDIRGEFLANDGGADDELVLAKARELTGRVPLFLSLLGAATAKQWGIRRINQALVEDTAERLAQGEIDLGKGPSIFYAYQESGLANHRPHIHHLAKYLWYMIAEKTTLSKRMLNYKHLQKDYEYRRIYEHPIVNYALFDEAIEALIAENLIEENTTEGVRYLSMKAPLTHLALKKDDVLGPRKVKTWDHLIEALNDLETSTDSEGK